MRMCFMDQHGLINKTDAAVGRNDIGNKWNGILEQLVIQLNDLLMGGLINGLAQLDGQSPVAKRINAIRSGFHNRKIQHPLKDLPGRR